MGIGVEGLTDEEKGHRAARLRRLLGEAQPYSPDVLPHIIPGLGPHPEAPVSSQLQLTIDAKSIHAVVKKIVRGCEFWLAGGRIVEPPYEIEVFFPTETPEHVEKLMAAFAFGPVHLGPGLRIRRGGDPLSAMYELVMWETMTVYASILPPEAKHPTARVISHEEITLHAYYHWERRGKPFGSPEVDWHWAIEDLNHHNPVIHIVGCNHGIQPGAGGFADFDGAEPAEQRGHFRTMVENVCINHAIQIVLEEDGDPEETAAKQIADRHKIPWRDINTSNNDKDRMGIPRDYVSGAYDAEQKREWHRQREQFMLERINEYGKGTQALLIICGFVHVQHLAALLAQGGTVLQRDYRTLGWYRRDIFAGDA